MSTDRNIPWQGTDGAVLTNSVLTVSVPTVVSSVTIRDAVRGTITASEATGETTTAGMDFKREAGRTKETVTLWLPTRSPKPGCVEGITPTYCTLGTERRMHCL